MKRSLSVIGVIIWFACCCVASQTRNRAEFKRIDVERSSQPQLIAASSISRAEVRGLIRMSNVGTCLNLTAIGLCEGLQLIYFTSSVNIYR